MRAAGVGGPGIGRIAGRVNGDWMGACMHRTPPVWLLLALAGCVWALSITACLRSSEASHHGVAGC